MKISYFKRAQQLCREAQMYSDKAKWAMAMRQQQEAERQRREKEERDRLADNDFIRALFEMINVGAKK
jgi:hypothetical protein